MALLNSLKKGKKYWPATHEFFKLSPKGAGICLGVIIGVGLGIFIGYALGRVGLGIAFGVDVGIILGYIIEKKFSTRRFTLTSTGKMVMGSAITVCTLLIFSFLEFLSDYFMFIVISVFFLWYSVCALLGYFDRLTRLSRWWNQEGEK
jgi:hypothetical protein